jgi:cytochrome c peroxidase
MKKSRMRTAILVGGGFLVCTAAAVSMALQTEAHSTRFVRSAVTAEDPPEVLIGERLFLETRFAQYYFAHSDGNPNAEPLQSGGDPVMATLSTPAGAIPGPFAGLTMNCRQCHLVDEASTLAGGGFRTYADFAARSPLPAREDGLLTTPRNSPTMLNLVLNKGLDELYHFDGEFASLEALVKGTFIGRNFGWLPSESTTAVHHIASIIRGDNGQGELAQEFGGSYTQVLAGNSTDPNLVLPPEYRIDVTTATDEEILDTLAKLVAAYGDSLLFTRNRRGIFTASPYDVFLQKNHLPRQPLPGELPLDYSRRLRRSLEGLARPRFVTPVDGQFALSDQAFVFGPTELAGLKVFLAEPSDRRPKIPEIARGGTGNCLACHAAPRFTDFKLHNTGVNQREYDAVHGEGAFSRLSIPTLAERNADYDAYLPATPTHPNAKGSFRRPPDANHPTFADLGAWNSYLNPDFSVDPHKIELAMGLGIIPKRFQAQALSQSIGRFKTPGLRDLGDSTPYFHNGSTTDLEGAVRFYKEFSAKARRGEVRNADPQLQRVVLSNADLEVLIAFLKSLKEDYN